MLSYQHAYHAGCPADVHKHLTLLLLLERLRTKSKPFCFVDCHAGRGVYDLTSAEATRTGEAETGIRRLAAACAGGEIPAAVRRYLDAVRTSNAPDGPILRYPGSPALARASMRSRDRGVLLELHPQEHAALRAELGADERFAIHRRDCNEGLPALLPPPLRRGLVLIDPSYELKSEYSGVPALLGRALSRWTNGIYAVWYPLLRAGRHGPMLEAIAANVPARMLISEYVYAPDAAGLRGSGLVIANPPWQLDRELAAAMNFVADALGDGSNAEHVLTRFD